MQEQKEWFYFKLDCDRSEVKKATGTHYFHLSQMEVFIWFLSLKIPTFYTEKAKMMKIPLCT
jgi:hypothetical protein